MSFIPGKTLVHVSGQVCDDAEKNALVEVATSMRITAGPKHRNLELDLAEWFGASHARLVNSGSSANLLAVAALMSPDLDRHLISGDEVITVAAGFPTTVAPLSMLGLVPVFVDVTGPNYNVDPALLEAAVSPRTKAVILAHTLGAPFDLAAVGAFCRRHGLWLVEDNCDAAGALYHGRKTGTFGDLATLSFYPAHHMTTGEGGAVLTNDPKLAQIVTSLRDWGRDCYCAPACDNTCGQRFDQQHGTLPYGYDHKYVYSRLGFNLKMTEMQAALGCVQLRKLDRFCAVRRANWYFYREHLADLSDVIDLPEIPIGTDPSPFGFLVTVRPNSPIDRNGLVRGLEEQKIQTRPLFAGNITRHPAMRGIVHRVSGSLTVTDVAMERAFWIGVYPGVTPEMRDWVVRSFHEVIR